MDLGMPMMGGAEAIGHIIGEFPDARIIALTSWDGDGDIHRALDAGARGYLLKDMVSNEVVGEVPGLQSVASAMRTPCLRSDSSGGSRSARQPSL